MPIYGIQLAIITFDVYRVTPLTIVTTFFTIVFSRIMHISTVIVYIGNSTTESCINGLVSIRININSIMESHFIF